MAANFTVEHARGSMISPKLPDYGAELMQTVKAIVAMQAAQARAAGGGRGGVGGGKVTGAGTITDPLTGESTDIALHGSKDERKAELKLAQNRLIREAVAKRAAEKDLAALDKMSVDKRTKTLQEIENSINKELMLKAPDQADLIRNTVSNAFSPFREETRQRKKAVEEASSLDALGAAVGSAWDYLKGMNPFQTDVELAQHARESAQREAERRAANAYLEDQYRMAQEGTGAWGRSVSSSQGRTLTNLLSGAIEITPMLAPVAAASAVTGGLGTAAVGGAVGAVSGRQDLMRRLAAEHPDWTNEQLAAAADEGDVRAMTTGAATNALLFNAGRVMPFARGFSGAAGQGVKARVAAGTAAADEATRRFAAMGRTQRLLPNVKHSVVEVVPATAGYQLGQNWAYNQAVGQESTLGNLMQNVDEAALAGLGFAAGLAGVRSIPKAKGTLTTSKTSTSETKGATDKVITDPNERRVEQFAKQKLEDIMPAEERKAAVYSSFDLLMRSDLNEAKAHIKSLQGLDVPLSEIKSRVASGTVADAAVKDYVDALSLSESKLVAGGPEAKSLQKTVRTFVNGLLDTVRGEKGKALTYDGTPESLQRMRDYIEANAPADIPPSYINSLLGELTKPVKSRNEMFKYAYNDRTKFTEAERMAWNKIMGDYRAALYADAAKRLEDAGIMSQVRTKLMTDMEKADAEGKAASGKQTGGTGKDVVADEGTGAPKTDTTDSTVDSQLGTDTPAAPSAVADSGTKAAGRGDTNIKGRGTGGEAKPDDGTTAQAKSATETGEPVSPEGANGRPDTEATAAKDAAAGEGAGGDATQNGGRERSTGDATGTGESKPASSGDAREPVNWRERVDKASRDKTAKDELAKLVEENDPVEAYSSLKRIVDDPMSLNKGAIGVAKSLINSLEKNHPELKAQNANNAAPVSTDKTVSTNDYKAVSSAIKAFSTNSPRDGAAALVKHIEDTLGPQPQVAYDALFGYATARGRKRVDKERAVHAMNILAGRRNIKQTDKQIDLIQRVCGN